MSIAVAHCRAGLALCIFLATLFSAVGSYATDQYVVVGSFRNLEPALQDAARIERQIGEKTDVVPASREHETVYRIVLGPYMPEEALTVKSSALQAGIAGAWFWSGIDQESSPIPDQSTSESPETDAGKQLAPIDTPETDRIEHVDKETSEAVATEVPTISLTEAVRMALQGNLSLLASQQQLEASEAGVRQAKAGLLPKLTSSIQQTAIDRDRAEAGFGRAPEYRATASVKLSQIIYSEDVKAAFDIQKMMHAAQTSDQKGILLDTILKASSSYLGLLRASSLAHIFEDDLRLSDSNYERAKIRLELGVANKAEVYRWETAQASARKDLVLAEAAVERARIKLNMVLNQPFGQEFQTVDPSLTDNYLLIADPVVWERLKNDTRVRELKNFLSAEALLFAPELASLRQKQAAQRRALKAAQRSLFFPSIALIVDGSKHVSDKGRGTEQLSISIPGTDTRFGGNTDNVEWSAAVGATLPLYSGGERYARIKKARAQLAQIDYLYDDALLKTQAAVLSKIADMRASLKNIELSKDAARASRNNLQLVTDSYERGVVTNIDLLDAQVALLSSELAAANTVYDFILEYLRLERVIGNFDIVSTPDQIAKARQRMDQFYK